MASSSTAMIDDDAKEAIVQKTWLFGQSVIPIYTLVLIWWYIRYNAHNEHNGVEDDDGRPWTLLFAIFALPYWCYFSYKAVYKPYDKSKKNTFTTKQSKLDSKTTTMLIIGGILMSILHLLILRLANSVNHHNTVIFIASCLFFIVTLSFVMMVTIFNTSLLED